LFLLRSWRWQIFEIFIVVALCRLFSFRRVFLLLGIMIYIRAWIASQPSLDLHKTADSQVNERLCHREVGLHLINEERLQKVQQGVEKRVIWLKSMIPDILGCSGKTVRQPLVIRRRPRCDKLQRTRMGFKFSHSISKDKLIYFIKVILATYCPCQ
jgi:hypothetical protein